MTDFGLAHDNLDQFLDALNSGDPAVRSIAVQHLALYKDERAVEALIHAMEDDSGEVRGYAADSPGSPIERDKPWRTSSYAMRLRSGSRSWHTWHKPASK